MAGKLEKQLSEMISEVGGPEGLITFLETEGVLTCADFFDCVKDPDELDAKVASKLQPPATSLRAVSSLRQVWRRAKKISESALNCDDLCPEDWEVPLPPTTKAALITKTTSAYSVVFRAWKMPCDSLLGRIFREREKTSLTVYPLPRVRSVATQPQHKQRETLSKNVVMEHGEDRTSDTTQTIFGFWLSLVILLNAYAIVGVDGWCPLQILHDYLDLVEKNLWHPRSKGLSHVREVEPEHRIKWCDLLRASEPPTLGQAIQASMTELAGRWGSPSFTLSTPVHQMQHSSQMEQPRTVIEFVAVFQNQTPVVS